jgi:hypothetical protein
LLCDRAALRQWETANVLDLGSGTAVRLPLRRRADVPLSDQALCQQVDKIVAALAEQRADTR